MVHRVTCRRPAVMAAIMRWVTLAFCPYIIIKLLLLNFVTTSRCVDSRPGVNLDCHSRCAVVVCCHLANRLALTVRENERDIANYISTNYSTTIYREHGAKNAVIAHPLPISTNYATIYRGQSIVAIAHCLHEM